MMNVIWYEDEDGICPLRLWVEKVKSVQDRARILREIDKLEYGNLGDFKPLGGGLLEKRLHFKPTAYRLYFVLDGENIIVLLSGSNKADQNKEILKAELYMRSYYEMKDKIEKVKVKGGKNEQI